MKGVRIEAQATQGAATKTPYRMRRIGGTGRRRFPGNVLARAALALIALAVGGPATGGESRRAAVGQDVSTGGEGRAVVVLTTEPAAEEAPLGPLARKALADRAALTEAGLERAEVEAAGRRLVVWRGGTGPHLVLLHGSGQQAGAWADVAPALLDDRTVHVLDLPGHGDSEPVEGTLHMSYLVEGVEAYLASLDGPAIVVGNSLGAWLATIAAHRHPETVARAVLVDGGALLNVPAEGLSLVPADREAARRVMAAVRDPASPQLTDEELDELVTRSDGGATARMLQDVPGLMAHLLDGRLGEVVVPVEVVWGASDRLMPLDYARRMTAALPRARLTVIERCGHIPPAECPDRFLAVLEELLASPMPAARAAEPEAATEPVAAAEQAPASGEPPADPEPAP